MAYGGYSNYVDLKYRPDPDENIIGTFYVEPTVGKTLSEAGEAVAAESSIGTWTTLTTMQQRVLNRLQARTFFIDKKNRIIKIAYPVDIFEADNAPQFLSDIAGNIFGMKEVDNIRLLDFTAPDSYYRSYPGPAFGMEGVRKIIGTQLSRRPHLGTIVKPKVGLNPTEHSKVGYESWAGGLDFVKDDENLTSHSFSKFEERVSKMLDAMDRAQSETGQKKAYAPNITAAAHVMQKRADYVKAQGGNCIMIDVVTAGLSGVQFMREQNTGMFIHAHRAMYAAFARYGRHGMSMKVLAKLCRMCGVDQLHIGGIVGKMEGSAGEIKQIHEDINGRMAGLKPVFSVCSGGLSPLSVPEVMNILGNDIVVQAGGGVHGHPQGTRGGAASMVQAMEAGMKRMPLEKYAKTHPELAAAVELWGKKKKK